MGLAPEFFTVLGICIFSGISLLSALLDEDMPRSVQWLFQGAAVVGLGELFVSQGFVNSGVFPRSPTDPTRFWISAAYLAGAIFNVIGLNVYLAAVRRKTALASMFSGAVTVPILLISALFVSSFLGSGGEVSFTPAAIAVLAVVAFVVGLSTFGFLREAFKPISGVLGGLGSSLTGPVSMPPGEPGTDTVSTSPATPGIGLPQHLHSMKEDEWEESPAKEGEQ